MFTFNEAGIKESLILFALVKFLKTINWLVVSSRKCQKMWISVSETQHVVFKMSCFVHNHKKYSVYCQRGREKPENIRI